MYLLLCPDADGLSPRFCSWIVRGGGENGGKVIVKLSDGLM